MTEHVKSELKPGQQALLDNSAATISLQTTLRRVDDLWINHILSPTLFHDLSNVWSVGLIEVLEKITDILPEGDGAQLDELRAALTKTLNAINDESSEFYDCDCPDREAIVTPDGLVCGTCGKSINPDPSLVAD